MSECEGCNGDTIVFNRGFGLTPCLECSEGKTLEELERDLGGYAVSAHRILERELIKEHNERLANGT